MTPEQWAEQLREACNGRPSAKIPWPHRLLHDAADAIDAQVAENERLRKDATPGGRSDYELRDQIYDLRTEETIWTEKNTSLRRELDAAKSELACSKATVSKILAQLKLAQNELDHLAIAARAYLEGDDPAGNDLFKALAALNKCHCCGGTGSIDAPYSGSDPSCPDCDGTGQKNDE